MTHKEALETINTILHMHDATWQEKKDLMADYIVNSCESTIVVTIHLLRSNKITIGNPNRDIIKAVNEYENISRSNNG